MFKKEIETKKKVAKTSKSSNSSKLTEEQIKNGFSVIDGEVCLHGLSSDQMDEMNVLEMGVDAYKKLKEIK